MAKKNLPVSPFGKDFYYPSLDGLRFFAFFVVFLHHFYFNQSSSNSIINYFLVIINKNGWIGVDLFFVLSGFLITTLLLKERERYGKFSLKNFWIRRALRIWPLYYLGLLVGFIILPYLYTRFFNMDLSGPLHQYHFSTQLPLYLLFLGNWSVVLNNYSPFPNIAHLWTISLEEQFYFFWPLLLFFIKGFKSTLIVGSIFLIIPLLVRTYLVSYNIAHPGIYANTFARIDILVLGGILALIYFYRPLIIEKLKIICKTPFLIFSLVAFFIFLHRISVFHPSIPRNVIFGYSIIGLFMVYLVIFALQTNTKFSKVLSFTPFVYLGKISYGLYVWHALGIDLSHRYFKFLPLNQILPIAALTLTIILGYISYNFYEAYFLRLKSKFTKISSRPV